MVDITYDPSRGLLDQLPEGSHKLDIRNDEVIFSSIGLEYYRQLIVGREQWQQQTK